MFLNYFYRFLTITSVIVTFLLNSSLYSAQTGKFSMPYTENGSTDYYYCYVPDNYDSTKAYPFLYALQGAGLTSAQMRDFICTITESKIEAIIVSPDMMSMNFAGLFTTSYNMVIKNYNIDKSKIITTGFIMGGTVAFEIALENPTYFSGSIALCPDINISLFTDLMWKNIKTMPLAIIVGDKDVNFTTLGTLSRDIKTKGGNIMFMLKPGVTQADNVYYNSEEFHTDYKKCFDFVTGATAVEESDNETAYVTICPNPIVNNFKVIFNTPSNDIVLRLYDLNGKIIYTCNNSSSEINNEQYISLEGYPAGIYMLEINSGGKVESYKVIKR